MSNLASIRQLYNKIAVNYIKTALWVSGQKSKNKPITKLQYV